MNVKDVMRQPFVITKDISIADAAKIMSNKDIGCLIFMKNEEVKGIVTERDILKHYHEGKKVSEIMSDKVITIESDKDLSRAFILMKTKKIKKLPVVDEGKLVGIITATDLVASMNDSEDNFFF